MSNISEVIETEVARIDVRQPVTNNGGIEQALRRARGKFDIASLDGLTDDEQRLALTPWLGKEAIVVPEQPATEYIDTATLQVKFDRTYPETELYKWLNTFAAKCAEKFPVSEADLNGLMAEIMKNIRLATQNGTKNVSATIAQQFLGRMKGMEKALQNKSMGKKKVGGRVSGALRRALNE